jgi:hypothetical protein
MFKSEDVIYANSDCFAFGCGHDLHISDQCISNNNSYCYSYSYNTT